MSEEAATLKITGLEKLIKSLGVSKPPVVQIGILGSKNVRTGKVNSNAAVGAAHEFGTTKLPERSFLRGPLTSQLPKEMEKAGALQKETLEQILKEGSLIPWLKKVAVIAEGVVADAFNTGGFGRWKPSNMANKKVHQTLVETQQLRNSITSRIVEK